MGNFKIELIDNLRRAIELHNQSEFFKLEAPFDEMDAKHSKDSLKNIDLIIAWNFWEGWVDEANHNFAGFYGGLEKFDWPIFAAELINSLEHGQPLNPVVAKIFDYSKRG